jgi:hypothetical protein
VQAGLIEVVCIDEFGEPCYRIASRFLAQHCARTGGSPRGPGPRPGVRARCAFGPSPLALPVSVGRPNHDAAGAVKGAEGERSDPLTVSAMLPPRPTEGVPYFRAWSTRLRTRLAQGQPRAVISRCMASSAGWRWAIAS